MADVTESDVRARVAEVEHRIARHQTALAFLEKELLELKVAVQVFERFHARPSYDDFLPPQEPQDEAESRKPQDAPPMAAMIATILLDSDGEPMEPKELLAEVRRRWWKSAPSTSVGPVAWRMAKDGQLIKEGQKYSLPKTAPSRPEGAV